MGMRGGMRGGWRSYIRAENDERPSRVDWQLIRRIAAYGRPYLGKIILLFITILISTGLSMLTPLILRELIDRAIPQRDVALLNAMALLLFAIPLLNSGVSVAQRWLNTAVGEGVIYDLRRALYSHLQGMAIRFYVHTKTGEIMSRLNNDVIGAQRAINSTVLNIITNVIQVLGVLFVMMTLEWRLTVAGLIVLPLVMLPARRIATRLRDLIREGMDQNAQMNATMNETLNINGAMLTKLFGRSQDEQARFAERAGAVRGVGIRQSVLSSLFYTTLGLISAFGTAVVYWLGGHLVLEGALTIGTLVAFAALLRNLYSPLQSLVNAPVELLTSLVSFERVFEVLDMETEIQEKPDAIALPQPQGRIRFEDVSFNYSGGELASLSHVQRRSKSADVPLSGWQAEGGPLLPRSQARSQALEDLNFTIEPGQLVALVGPSGAGKSTLSYLLPRLYDPTEGVIRLDGHDLRDLKLADLARHIGMVTQESFLFHDSIRANLLYARPDASQAEIEAACTAANIHDFIRELPQGYDTLVGERGYRLSGGEKQRIALARIILKDPQILVLDEATAHLDSQSEALIQEALERVMQGRTSIVIAHRLSTILAADQILVLDRGRLVEQGTHAELVAQGGLYAELAATQFGAMEAAVAAAAQ